MPTPANSGAAKAMFPQWMMGIAGLLLVFVVGIAAFRWIPTPKKQEVDAPKGKVEAAPGPDNTVQRLTPPPGVPPQPPSPIEAKPASTPRAPGGG